MATSLLYSLMSAYQTMKAFVEQVSPVTSDAIHVLVGCAAILVISLLSRRTLSEWLPWVGVLVLELLNEAVDLSIEHWPTRTRQFGESAKDILLTMAVPTLLLACARTFPRLWNSGARCLPQLAVDVAESEPETRVH